ncbi:MAG: CopD family protein [Gammaproteobacteria bacterium]|nr:CopD family protein [Gammaproteobacteria bacterium]
MSLASTLHILSVVIWVGGMFFAYVILRPAAASLLEPPQRLSLWRLVFNGFFPLVWASIITILASGLWMIMKLGGFAAVAGYVNTMFALGLVMMALFMHVFFAPYRRLKKAVAEENWPEGGKQLNMIRKIVGINTLIGVLTIIVATAGKSLI